ncbi:MAG TPA: response regulator [Gemmatimonadales bacterium]|nr:response regulator [Gemmatimonadales bacterium]
MRYLVIEDDAKVAAFMAAVLRDEGHEVTVLGEGTGAPEQILAGGFDAVLLDHMLPGLSGPEIIQQVRGAGSAVPILLVSARDSAEDISAGLAAGANDYITKPFRLADLLGRLDALAGTDR